MCKKNLIVLALVILTGAAVSTVHADALDCGGGIISTGDSRSEVLVKCGEPDFKDTHTEEITEKIDPAVKHKTIITVDEWTYNFGPERLVRVVTLRNGRVSDISSRGYGSEKTREDKKKASPAPATP